MLHGLPKIHKKFINGIPKFRPILSAIGTCSYKLAKFLVPILKDISGNEFTIHNSFEFGKEVLQQDPSLFMASLDVEALFTSLPLLETIDICINELFENKDTVNDMNRGEFKTFWNLPQTSHGSYLMNNFLDKSMEPLWARR